MAIKGLPPLTELFVEGVELVIRPEGETPADPPAVLVWINKLNPFETDEARRAGAVARARLILAMKKVGTPEYELYQASSSRLDAVKKRTELLDNQGTEWWGKAFNSVRTDPEWAERYSLIQREVAGATPEETTALLQLQQEYTDEIDKRLAGYRDDRERELLALDEGSLGELHEEAWLERQGASAFAREFQRQQIFFALRVCRATHHLGDRWDHSGCDHTITACDSVQDVAKLPDKLMSGVIDTLARISVQVDDARFSAEAASSSAPSPQPSKAEESARSGQEVTSDELATTSS